MATRMLQRRGTAAEWASVNPILSDGEIGEEEDTHQMKIGSDLHWNDTPYSIIAPAMIDAKGDLIVGSANDAVERLARGTVGQHLVVQADGSLAWVKPDFVPNSVTNQTGDMIIGGPTGTPITFTKGIPGQIIRVSAASGNPEWVTPSADVPLSTVTTAGDLIQGSGAGAVARLAKGANGQVLTVVGGVLTWVTPSAGVPLATVTTAEDLIVGSGVGAVKRVGKGTNGQRLTVVGGVLTWQDPTADVPLATVTTAGDLIVGSGSGTVARLARGSDQQILGMNGATVAWLTRLGYQICTSTTRPAGPAVPTFIYETDTKAIKFWDGTGWVTMPTYANLSSILVSTVGNTGRTVMNGGFTISLSAGISSLTTINFPTGFVGTPSVAATAGLITGNSPGTIINLATVTTASFNYMARLYSGTYTGTVNAYYVASDS